MHTSTDQIPTSPNMVFLTYPDHGLLPPRFLPPIPDDPLAKLIPTSLPPLCQPLPALKSTAFDTKETGFFPPITDSPRPKLFPTSLPPINQYLPPLQSSRVDTNGMSTTLSTYYKPMLSSSSDIHHTPKRKKHMHSSQHRKNTVSPQQYQDKDDEEHLQVTKEPSCKTPPREFKISKAVQQIHTSDEVTMHHSNESDKTNQQLCHRSETLTSHGNSGKGRQSLQSNSEKSYASKNNNAAVPKNIPMTPHDTSEPADKTNAVQHDQNIVVNDKDEVDKHYDSKVSVKEGETPTLTDKMEIPKSESKSQENDTSQSSATKPSLAEQEMVVEVPLTDTIWPQTLD